MMYDENNVYKFVLQFIDADANCLPQIVLPNFLNSFKNFITNIIGQFEFAWQFHQLFVDVDWSGTNWNKIV